VPSCQRRRRHEKIPNNVDLTSDKRLQRALEEWQPNFIKWWNGDGPRGLQQDEVYLRTAVSVDHEGWAHFDYVKMPDYRWGIFLTDPVADRTIGFGDEFGKPAWQQVPGEHRNALRRLIVTQGDTEPASVEQQRLLGQTCPSLYDLRNLFQVNVEEGRHLWAMVYLLHSYFGRDGREEADACSSAARATPTSPASSAPSTSRATDWLSFFMFTYFTDRDGKYQLLALAESAFDPLSRTTRFMLTEEAHHMFVGETGVLRVVQRTVRADEARPQRRRAQAQGGIDLATRSRSTSTSGSRSRSTSSAARCRPTRRASSPRASRAAPRRSSTRTTSRSTTYTVMPRRRTAASSTRTCRSATR
jgi:benzoyl-CoA 2,3-dioxygenase component B